MKAIILVSSIFYIIGLKIGNNINVLPKDSIQKVIIHKASPAKKSDSYIMNEVKDASSKQDTTKIVKQNIEGALDKG